MKASQIGSQLLAASGKMTFRTAVAAPTSLLCSRFYQPVFLAAGGSDAPFLILSPLVGQTTLLFHVGNLCTVCVIICCSWGMLSIQAWLSPLAAGTS